MPTVLPGYLRVIAALEPVLHNLPPKLIGIEGPNGVGKTTFARYLAWYFNVTLLEGDLFTIAGPPPNNFHISELNRLIDRRLGMSRPIILEFCWLHRMLQD